MNITITAINSKQLKRHPCLDNQTETSLIKRDSENFGANKVRKYKTNYIRIQLTSWTWGLRNAAAIEDIFLCWNHRLNSDFDLSVVNWWSLQFPKIPSPIYAKIRGPSNLRENHTLSCLILTSTWMKKRMDMQREINYYMHYSEMLDSCQESLTGSSARSRGNKDQSGLLYRLHYREYWSPPSAGHQFMAIRGLLFDTGWG